MPTATPTLATNPRSCLVLSDVGSDVVGGWHAAGTHRGSAGQGVAGA